LFASKNIEKQAIINTHIIMEQDLKIIKNFYLSLPARISQAQKILARPLTLAEKILFTHLYNDTDPALASFQRGTDYVNFRPDRVAMQDATAQMALLQFINAGRKTTAVPATVHCDHLIQADLGAQHDLLKANDANSEVYDFLRTTSGRYGIGFWKPGAGIIHQIVLENYAFPGGMIIGTDSHTPNAGGLGMIAIGVGGADAVDVMSGMEWELKLPKLTGVYLTGKLNGWTSAKDVILKIAGMLTVKGGTNSILEYFGPGADTLTATGKATICNMGAEIGATTSLFPFDQNMADYLRATNRSEVADYCSSVAACLRADKEIEISPEKYYDRIIEIDLSSLEPYVNGPFTPDAATPISMLAAKVKENNYPTQVEVGLIGSCTNSSLEDMTRAASIARQAFEQKIPIPASLVINPGSEQVRQMTESSGLMTDFNNIGATIMANACGPCIGQWKRHTDNPEKPNSIVTSFNRNFAKRADGNPNTHAFVASPEITMALTIAGNLCFNPLTDSLKNINGEYVRLSPPAEFSLPLTPFLPASDGYIAPHADNAEEEITINPSSERLQLLAPFDPPQFGSLKYLRLLIKVEGKCTTDHISMAGSWLRYRGHLANISKNLLMGAVNAFNGKTNSVLNTLNNEYSTVSSVAEDYKNHSFSSIVIADENYGEGSSREHAAMEPRFLNVKAIIAKSFARIHETNLKKQGMLALTFAKKSDYDSIRETDLITIHGTETFTPDIPLTVSLLHEDGTEESFLANHTYNDLQIRWYKAGSALNYLKSQSSRE
jgi:aconitate hydratase